MGCRSPTYPNRFAGVLRDYSLSLICPAPQNKKACFLFHKIALSSNKKACFFILVEKKHAFFFPCLLARRTMARAPGWHLVYCIPEPSGIWYTVYQSLLVYVIVYTKLAGIRYTKPMLRRTHYAALHSCRAALPYLLVAPARQRFMLALSQLEARL